MPPFSHLNIMTKYVLARLYVLWVFAALALGHGQVIAGNPYIYGGEASGVFNPGPMNEFNPAYRSVTLSPAADAVLIKDQALARVGVRSVPMAGVRAIGLTDALALGARAIPAIGTAALAYSIYKDFRCVQEGGTLGLWSCDPGVPKNDPVPFQYRTCTGASNAPPCYYGNTPQEACWASPTNGGEHGTSGLPTNCYTYKNGAFSGNTAITKGNYTGPGPDKCSPAGPDGLCPGGSLQNSLSAESVAAAIAATNSPELQQRVKDNAAAMVKDALNAKIDVSGKAAVRPMEGPSSVTQPSTNTTKTAANGTTQTSTTTVTNNITYGGDTYNISNTTVTNNPDGSTETKSDTPAPTDCEKNPDSAGCTKLGDPGTSTIPTDTKNVTFTPVQFSESAACPAPVSFTAFSRSYELSYQPMCDTISTWVRALVIASGAFIGAYVFVSGLKS